MRRALYQWLALLSLVVVQAAAVEVPAEVDAAFRRYLALPEPLVRVLAQAKDKNSAEAAAEALQDILPQVYDARQALGKINGLSAEVAAEVRRRYEKDMRTSWGKVLDHLYRLQGTRCYGSAAFMKQFEVLCLLLEK